MGKPPESPHEHNQHDEVHSLGDAVPDTELEFGVLSHFVRVGLGFDHGRWTLALDLKFILLLMPDGEFGANPFASEQCEAKQDADVKDWFFWQGAGFFQPIGE